jgi:hypothetical protein
MTPDQISYRITDLIAGMTIVCVKAMIHEFTADLTITLKIGQSIDIIKCSQ